MESGHQIQVRNTAYFRHDFDSEHADMRRLYEQAKIDQWNAATDIDWARPLESDGGLIADDLVDIHGTKFWDRLSADERVELNRCVTRRRLSTLMHGEHGAMLVCSQLVEDVQGGQDAKLVPGHPGGRRRPAQRSAVSHCVSKARPIRLPATSARSSTPCSAPLPST
jgi:hypothetical protein